MKTLLALLLLSVNLFAQLPVTIFNPSPPRTEGWVSFTVPDSTIPKAGTLMMYPDLWPVYIGEKVGPNARLVHIKTGKMKSLERKFGLIKNIKQTEDKPSVKAEDVLKVAKLDALDQVKEFNPFPTVVVKLDLKTYTWTPTNLKVVESSLGRSVFHSYGRINGTMFVVNMWFYVYPQHRTVPFELLITNSDPRSETQTQHVDEIGMLIADGIYPVVDFLKSRGGSNPVAEEGNVYVKLHGSTWFGDSQSAAWNGRLLLWVGASPADVGYLVPDLTAPLVGMAMNWKGHWGPWGEIPDLHPKEMDQERGDVAAKRNYSRFLEDLTKVGSVWSSPLYYYGTSDKPSSTGAQQGFGATKFAPLFGPLLGNPAHIFEVMPSVLKDLGRQGKYYEIDGTQIDLEKHPKWKTWGCITHWHPNISEDRLGKKPWDPSPANVLMAKDWAHMSSNILAGYAVLTGSHMARHGCRSELLCLVANHGSLGETRAYGRAVHSAVWDFLATGDPLFSKFFDHISTGKNSWIWESYTQKNKLSKEVAPLATPMKHGSWWQGKYDFWMPWQESLVIYGLDAYLKQNNSPAVEAVLESVCRNWVKWGWWKYGDGYHTFWVLRFPDENKPYDVPISKQAYDSKDAEYVRLGDGGITNRWSWGSLIIARRHLLRMREQALVEKVDGILTDLNNRRLAKNPPFYRPIGFDVESEWKAVK